MKQPIGLQLTRTSKLVTKAFDDAMAAAGATLPTWLVLVSIKRGDHSNQRALAQMVGISDATLTHHLAHLTEQGLISRERDPANQRVQLVTLTDAGEALFETLLSAAQEFDTRLWSGLSPTELDQLAGLLDRLESNVTGVSQHS